MLACPQCRRPPRASVRRALRLTWVSLRSGAIGFVAAVLAFELLDLVVAVVRGDLEARGGAVVLIMLGAIACGLRLEAEDAR